MGARNTAVGTIGEQGPGSCARRAPTFCRKAEQMLVIE